MKKLVGILKIKSISDAITNSSTEVFLNKNTDAFKKFAKTFKYIKFISFETEEDVKKYVMEDDMWYNHEELSYILSYNPIYDWHDYFVEYNLDKETIWPFIKYPYLELIGQVAAFVCDENSTDDLWKELSLLQYFTETNGGYFDRR